jgi:hypothetical protein
MLPAIAKIVEVIDDILPWLQHVVQADFAGLLSSRLGSGSPLSAPPAAHHASILALNAASVSLSKYE